jgi:flavin-dependent dehydrogenase
MPFSHPITIIGGGLAGLAAGAALARHGAKVTLCEAGRLPRPRVCGEFISGLKPNVVERLALAPHLRDAALNRTTGWHVGGRLRWAATLPEPALGLSRPTLEARLLRDFAAAGGEMRLNERVQISAIPENSAGLVWAAGRRPDSASVWLGLKIHCHHLPLGHDLELHLGKSCYVGATRIENGRVNVCGLFRAQPDLRAPRESLLLTYLTACGLEKFATRVADGDPDPASAAAVSGLDFTRTWREQNRLSLGDHYAPIPPYTGHGMALALESAACALDPLLAYARGEIAWPETVHAVRREISTAQDLRLRWARRLHPWLLHPAGQKILLTLAATRLLPFQFFYHATHRATYAPNQISPVDCPIK